LVRRIKDTKANKKELNVIQTALDAMENKLLHLSVFQSELAKTIIPNSNS